MRQLKNEQGFAMVLALLTLVLVTVIGTALIIVSSNVAKTAGNERDDQAAFYNAESKVNKAIADMKPSIIAWIEKSVTSAQLSYNQKDNTQSLDYWLDYHFQKDIKKNMKSFDNLPIDLEFDENSSSNKRLVYKLNSSGEINRQTRNVSENLIIDSPSNNLINNNTNSPKPTLPDPKKYSIITNSISLNGSFAFWNGHALAYKIEKNAGSLVSQGKLTKSTTYINLNHYLPNIPGPSDKTFIIDNKYTQKNYSVETDKTYLIIDKDKLTSLESIDFKNQRTIISIINNKGDIIEPSKAMFNKFKNSSNAILISPNLSLELQLFPGALYIQSKSKKININNSMNWKNKAIYTDSKYLDINGSATITTAIIAPYVELKLNGSASFAGTMIIESLDLVGSATYNYIENNFPILPEEEPFIDNSYSKLIKLKPLKEQ